MVELDGARVLPRTRVAALMLGVLAAVVALTLWGATPAGAETDSDGDGVVDTEDAFPDDPTRAVSCPAGFYGAFSCTPAPPGTYVAEPGALAATPCFIGTYQAYAGSVSCDVAPPGTYVDSFGAVTATPCPIGSFQSLAGSVFCNLASPGTYVDSAGSAAATPCPVGSYQPLAGAISCNLAAPGTYVDSEGAVAATPCPVGSFQPLAGAPSCVLAPVGSYVDSIGATAATACPSGTTTTALGATSSSACVTVAAVPSSKQACKQNGWRSLTDSNGRPFRNQGDCVSFVATGGRNPAAG